MELNPLVDEQIGEYHLRTKTGKRLNVPVYNVYGERTFYVPSDNGPIPYYSIEDVCDDYGCEVDSFENIQEVIA